MATHVKKVTYTPEEWGALKEKVGSSLAGAICLYLRRETGVPDLTFKDFDGDGEKKVLYVESQSFPANERCWKGCADEWPEGKLDRARETRGLS